MSSMLFLPISVLLWSVTACFILYFVPDAVDHAIKKVDDWKTKKEVAKYYIYDPKNKQWLEAMKDPSSGEVKSVFKYEKAKAENE